MRQLLPTYIRFTPDLGELRWDLAPGDELLSVQLGWMKWLKKHNTAEILETRQGFTAVSIRWKSPEFQDRFSKTVSSLSITPDSLSKTIWEIPVCYEEPYGPDLTRVAHGKQMRVDELIELHVAGIYRIHFFGFLPGFMYLNGLPKVLHTPRKAIPDRSVARGSVGIGGSQTGIYPMESPGGWQILGRTPVQLFNAQQVPPVWATPGDRIQFVKISNNEMNRLLENPTFPTLR